MKRISKRTMRVLIAYLMGNGVQIILQTLAKNTWMDRPILFCIASGFLVFIAIVAGVTLATADNSRLKTYADYAAQIDLHDD